MGGASRLICLHTRLNIDHNLLIVTGQAGGVQCPQESLPPHRGGVWYLQAPDQRRHQWGSGQWSGDLVKVVLTMDTEIQYLSYDNNTVIPLTIMSELTYQGMNTMYDYDYVDLFTLQSFRFPKEYSSILIFIIDQIILIFTQFCPYVLQCWLVNSFCNALYRLC